MALLLVLMCGCAASAPKPAAGNAQIAGEDAPNGSPLNSQLCGNVKVVDLWKERMGSQGDFRLGPGDVLQVSSGSISELKDKVVRLDANGNVSLPLIGDMKLAGLTEKDAKEAIETRLGEYMYHPEVSVFVQTYHSRQVAVVGSVAAPGLYTLSPDDTIGSIIQHAGGMSRDAAQEVFFTPMASDKVTSTITGPAEGNGSQKTKSAPPIDGSGGTLRPISTESPEPQPGAPLIEPSTPPGQLPVYSTEQPLLINLVANGGPGCLGLPLRPGDQIDVPLGGTVKVIGWVNSPHAVQLSPGLTALGAVAASGGPLFAADMNNVQVIRQGHNQDAQIIKVNLNKVQELKEPDVVLETNDIVQVSYSVVRLPGYAVYYATIALVQFAPAALIVSGIP
ncbi:MAG TPA: polysaccharide biosynthesis/export family protein [Candidatus Binataceae bacterium]|nr:polysaccharide biosynthesis/export family protein [Candidatus Binataceae bacterium]